MASFNSLARVISGHIPERISGANAPSSKTSKRFGFNCSSSGIRVRAWVRRGQIAQNSVPKTTENNFPNHRCIFPNYFEALISTIIVVADVFRVTTLLAGISVLRLERFNQCGGSSLWSELSSHRPQFAEKSSGPEKYIPILKTDRFRESIRTRRHIQRMKNLRFSKPLLKRYSQKKQPCGEFCDPLLSPSPSCSLDVWCSLPLAC
jgi:hypothetical protein